LDFRDDLYQGEWIETSKAVLCNNKPQPVRNCSAIIVRISPRDAIARLEHGKGSVMSRNQRYRSVLDVISKRLIALRSPTWTTVTRIGYGEGAFRANGQRWGCPALLKVFGRHHR